MPYALGIDLGSGRVTAAISRNDRERWRKPEVVALDGDPAGAASVLHVTDQDAVEVGSAALRALPARAGWVTRDVADRIGDEIPVTLGGQPYPAEVLTAALVGWVVDQVEATEGVPASQLVITHPAGWGVHRRGLLLAALREVNLPELTLLPRPVAAAESHAGTQRVEVGEEIAVYSLGSGRFESAVLRRGKFGFELRAHADGVEPVGGTLFDDLLAEHVLASLKKPPEGLAAAKLRLACTAAKERLSVESSVSVSGVRVTRAEFEELIRPAVESTVESLRRTIRSAGGESVGTVVLVGGCGRIPLVTELVAAGPRARVAAAADPETSIARGAAMAAARVAKPTVRATALTMTPEPIARSAVTHTDLMRLDDLPEEDLTELGPPPPRPPVELMPLEPPKRRLLPWGGRDRDLDRPSRRSKEDREFADLDLELAPAKRRRNRELAESQDPAQSTFDENLSQDPSSQNDPDQTDDEDAGAFDPHARSRAASDLFHPRSRAASNPADHLNSGSRTAPEPTDHLNPSSRTTSNPADHLNPSSRTTSNPTDHLNPSSRRVADDPVDSRRPKSRRAPDDEVADPRHPEPLWPSASPSPDVPRRRGHREPVDIHPADTGIRQRRGRHPDHDPLDPHLPYGDQPSRRRHSLDHEPVIPHPTDMGTHQPREPRLAHHPEPSRPQPHPHRPEPDPDPLPPRHSADRAHSHHLTEADSEPPRRRHAPEHEPLHPRHAPADEQPRRRHAIDREPDYEPLQPRHPGDADDRPAEPPRPRRHRYLDPDDDFAPAPHRADRDGGRR